MSQGLIAWVRVITAIGTIISLVLAIIAYVRFRVLWLKTPRPFFYRLLPIKNIREFYIFAILAIIVVILANITIRLE